jgi:hypothetical protein
VRSAIVASIETRDALGVWSKPGPAAPCQNLRFRMADADQSSPGATSDIVLEFVLEPGETANSTDDDGDGLTDEGALLFSEAGTELEAVPLLREVEHCALSLDGSVLQVTLLVVSRDGARLLRTRLTSRFLVRNS